MAPEFMLRPIGYVESALTEPDTAPRQGDEGAPDSWLAFEPDMREALDGLRPGDEIVVITWLHLADRTVLRVHPRGDQSRPMRGVFSTRSQHRPNPLGIHVVKILGIEGLRVHVHGLEAIHGTPVVDVKSALEPPGRRSPGG
jgi:tRNA-Thr(GGU) m(6)t(6)A37 methyltransferase TsaA